MSKKIYLEREINTSFKKINAQSEIRTHDSS